MSKWRGGMVSRTQRRAASQFRIAEAVVKKNAEHKARADQGDGGSAEDDGSC
jgi:hypothetical protein